MAVLKRDWAVWAVLVGLVGFCIFPPGGHAQAPATPSAPSAATGTITILLNGQVIGSAPVLNLQATGTKSLLPGGVLWSCTPDSALNSIDCTQNINSAVAVTFSQLYGDPVYCSSVTGTTNYGCSLNAFSSPPTKGMRVDLVADTPCPTTCTLNLTPNSGAGLTITQNDGMTAPNGSIVAGQMKQLWFDGSVFRII